MRTVLVCLALAGSVVLVGCGGDDRPAECEEIVEACHEVDTGTGMVHECHEGAEADWSKEECVAMRSECLADCAAAGVDGGTPDGGGTADGGL